MKNKPLNLLVREFIKKKRLAEKPLLLGFSGGVDSSVLLHLLLDCKQSLGFDLHLAHVDHGWRKESQKEAKTLEELAKKLKIPFHTKRLNIEKPQNLEEVSRNLRFVFFEELFEKYDFEALILAHHLNDVAETTIKRVFEGADLLFLGGMQEESKYNQMKIWRPLLSVSKKQIFSWQEKKGISFVEDATNLDERFLRSRMREKMIPALQAQFGKNFSNNLFLLSKRSFELENYFAKKLKKYIDLAKKGPKGWVIDLKPCDIDELEMRFLIKLLAKKFKIVLSREMLSQMIESLLSNKKRKIEGKNRLIIIDRKQIFFLEQKESLYN